MLDLGNDGPNIARLSRSLDGHRGIYSPPTEANSYLGPPEIVLDLSRLISRIQHLAPTGVDRVEMAYALQLLKMAPNRLSFAVVHPFGRYGRISSGAAVAFLQETQEIWSGAAAKDRRGWRRRLGALLALYPKPTPTAPADRMRSRVYLQVSPHHLDRPQLVGRILARERARFVCLVHDLIPIEYPEHARPNGLALHRRRMDTLAKFADGLIAATDTTKRSFQRYAPATNRPIEMLVSPLGAEAPHATHVNEGPGGDYFVSIGTIEPRKNHLMLLNVWRRMVDELGPRATPKLVLIGRRGWENENILDMLDRCSLLKGVVEERGHLSEEEMWPLVAGARALLMPSFVEGFGLPVAEALGIGVPVICSDIPAHREIADGVAEFLDPLDGPGWKRTILNYASSTGSHREAQLRRMGSWSPPTWDKHVRAALALVDRVGGETGVAGA